MWWIAGALGLVLLAAGAAALNAWVGGAGLRERIEAEASAALGSPVRLGGLSVSWLPIPALELRDLSVGAGKTGAAPLRLGQVLARPAWTRLPGVASGGPLVLHSLEVQDAQISQSALDRLLQDIDKARRQRAGAGAGAGARPQAAGVPQGAVPLPELGELRLSSVRWIAQAGWSSTLDARIALDGLLPTQVQARVTEGRWKGAELNLEPGSRQPGAAGGSGWKLLARIGGGTVQGPLVLDRPQAGKPWRVRGELVTQGVEVAALTAPARPLSGELEARTTLDGQAAEPAALLDALGTQTRFTVRRAVVHGVDLAKAVGSVGLSRGGQTGFDTITGSVSTRGRAVALRDVAAGSALLSARANVDISPSQALSGRVVVDIAGGLAGVPLAIGGTVAQPEISLTRGGALGAALGTAVLPGVGTGVGAKLGDKLQGLFGK